MLCGAGEDLFLLLVRVRGSEWVGVIPAALSDSKLGVQPRWRAQRGMDAVSAQHQREEGLDARGWDLVGPGEHSHGSIV